MSSVTISKAMAAKAGPYTGSVKAKVVARDGPTSYKSGGEDRQSLTVGLADQSGAAKGIIYDPQQFPRFQEGNCVVVKNFILRGDKTIVITRNSRSFLSGGVEVSEDRKGEARRLVNPPPAAFVSLEATKTSPVKTMLSVRGQIVQEDQEREVMVGQTPTRLKDVYLGDSHTRVKLTLWRESCDMVHRPGDFVEVTDVVTNIHKGETSLSLTSRSKMKAAEAPLEVKTVSVEGIGGTPEEKELFLDGGETVSVQGNLLDDAFGDENADEYICAHSPVQLRMHLRGATVEKITRM